MRVHINNFTGGEMAPYMESRTDLPALVKGCRLARNMVVRTTGGALRRHGMMYQWTAKHSDRECCLLPFNFSDEDAFVLEFGHNYIRFGKEGELIESGGNTFEVESEWDEDELFQLKYVQVNDIMWTAGRGGCPFQLSRVADDDWRLESIHDLIAAGAESSGNAWPAMLDENITAATLTVDNTVVGPAVMTASEALFEAEHVGSFWEISHRRDTAFVELRIPILPPASAEMRLSVLPVEGQIFVINGTAYTWKAEANVTGPFHVGIDDDGGTLAERISNSRGSAVGAINGDTIIGEVLYGRGTAPHTDVTASFQDDTNTPSATAVLTGDGTNRLSFPNLGGTVNVVVRVGSVFYGFMQNPVTTLFNGATYNVKMGATEKESLQNLVKAITASGTNAVDYWGPSGVTANADASAALTADNQVTVTAKTSGDSGNSVVVSVSNTNLNPEPLTWNTATLTGGGAAGFYKVIVEARDKGVEGNDITTGGSFIGILGSSDAGVSNVSDGNTVAAGGKTYLFKNTLTPVANEVLIGGSWDASVLNLSRAINLTGTPGTDYALATTINDNVFAAATVTAAHQLVIVSKVVNPTTNLATTSVGATLVWGAATLQSPWNTPTLTGGTDFDGESEGFEVLGDYRITSYGLWDATVFLERRVSIVPERFEIVRQWTGNNDRNITEAGTAESPEFLRLRVANGAGTAASDAAQPRFIIEASDARIYGLVRVTEVVSETEANVNVVRALFSTDETTLWSEGAWSDYRGWPQMIALHEQRLVFGGTAYEPERLWASATSDLLNYRRGSADANSWSRILAADESSRIVWGASLGGGLIIGKPKEDWLVTSGDAAQSITPTQCFAKEQSQYGSANLQPLVVASRLLFVQEGGRNLLEYAFSWEQQSFNAADLAELALHFTRSGIKQMAYAKKPDDIVWVVTEDGKLLSLTYKRREDGSVLAWAYHPTSGTVESVTVINGDNGLDDVYVSVKRTVEGGDVRFVERMDSYTGLALENAAALYDEWLTDPTDANWSAYMAERVKLTYLDVSLRVTVDEPATSFTGFDHLNGMTVNVQADGSEHSPVVVNEGTITLTRSATTVLAGLPYTSQLRGMPFSLQLGDGTSDGRKWKVSSVTLRYYRTAAGQYSDTPTGSTKWDAAIRTAQDPVNAPVPLFSGIREMVITGTYNPDAGVWMGTSGAEPFGVLSLTPSFTIHST